MKSVLAPAYLPASFPFIPILTPNTQTCTSCCIHKNYTQDLEITALFLKLPPLCILFPPSKMFFHWLILVALKTQIK